MHDYTEDALIEQPAIALLQQMGWQHVNAFHETFGPHRSPDLLRCRTRDLLLPKLVSGEVDLSGVKIG